VAAAARPGRRHPGCLRRRLRPGDARLPFANSSPNIKIVRSGEIPDDSYAQAKRRAAKLNAAYGDHVQWSLRDPYTDVYEFVEKALGITSY
jgi:hypothetical protein